MRFSIVKLSSNHTIAILRTSLGFGKYVDFFFSITWRIVYYKSIVLKKIKMLKIDLILRVAARKIFQYTTKSLLVFKDGSDLLDCKKTHN